MTLYIRVIFFTKLIIMNYFYKKKKKKKKILYNDSFLTQLPRCLIQIKISIIISSNIIQTTTIICSLKVRTKPTKEKIYKKRFHFIHKESNPLVYLLNQQKKIHHLKGY